MEVWGSKTDFLREVGGFSRRSGRVDTKKWEGWAGQDKSLIKIVYKHQGANLRGEISTPKVCALLPPLNQCEKNFLGYPKINLIFH